ncbi:MAG: hypothetical protein AMXMBFR20_14830 [Planctomycetia bacterium]
MLTDIQSTLPSLNPPIALAGTEGQRPCRGGLDGRAHSSEIIELRTFEAQLARSAAISFLAPIAPGPQMGSGCDAW